jgi:ATP-dependent Clp protease protease subunit
MSKRNLPLAPTLSVRAPMAFDPSPAAIERWNGAVMAADKDSDNTISVLETIGEDWWTGGGVTAKRIAAALRSIGADRDVVVNVNSPGGDFFEGLAIYNLLREHKGQVTVKVLGLAASAASIIAMAGDRVEIARAGFLMIHNTWIVAIGNRHDLREAADFLEPFDQAAVDVYAARSGLEAAEIAAMMDRDTFIAGSQAVEKGFADALLPADEIAEDAEANAATVATVSMHRLDVVLAKSGMPRSARRKLIHELSGTPGAAAKGTPGAAEPPKVSEGVITNLHAALGAVRG